MQNRPHGARQMDGYQSEQPRRGSARERRLRRRQARIAGERAPVRLELGEAAGVHVGPAVNRGLELSYQMIREVRTWPARRQALAAGSAVLALFLLAYLLPGRIFPNVWALNLPIGGLSVEDAASQLEAAWQRSIRIQLRDGERDWSATPADLGLSLDAEETARRARGAGLAGIPFGFGVAPAVTFDRDVAETFLLSLTSDVDYAPVNAGFAWENEALVGVPGTEGRQLDVPATLDALDAHYSDTAQRQLLELVVDPVEPEVADAGPLLEEASEFVSRPFELRGYDPFSDDTITWSTSKETFVSWLEAGGSGLTLRADAFAPFVTAQNASLDTGTQARYLDEDETVTALREAIEAGESTALLRIRHRESVYTVEPGDTAYRVARKTGMPFYLIEQANPGRNLDVLSPGDTLNVPSPDPMVPLTPVPDKRIVVNLDTQSLVAFENGTQVFSWLISSGMESAPTSPGVYQILSHEDVAYGSSYTLCGANGCGQWEMNWFMGIYEVVPGLMNGFHGAVLLPNGGYLGGGNVGQPYTFGCVMSRDDQAKLLYDWADEGTIVEIISSEYAPRSALAQSTLSGAA